MKCDTYKKKKMGIFCTRLKCFQKVLSRSIYKTIKKGIIFLFKIMTSVILQHRQNPYLLEFKNTTTVFNNTTTSGIHVYLECFSFFSLF